MHKVNNHVLFAKPVDWRGAGCRRCSDCGRSTGRPFHHALQNLERTLTMNSHVQVGKNSTLPVPAATLSGHSILVGSLFGVASCDTESGDDLNLVTVGTFELANVSADAFAISDPLHFGAATKLITPDDDFDANPDIGVSMTVAAKAVADDPSGRATVLVDR